MAQQAAAPLVHALPESLDYLNKPSEAHVFLFSVFGGVIATWILTILVVLNFHSY